jgi:4-amino-4-deoxy-L-arabinose transferase-like glycosyltransferase
MRETIWHVAVILLVTLTVFFTNLGTARLWDRDEPRNAGCAAEMVARGDWVVPMFNDELRHQKPVLLYWLVMSAYSVFGVNEFSARFWSALLAIGTTLATYTIAHRLINATVALYAAIALATSLMFGVAARAVTPDSVLIFCATSALMIYVISTFVRAGERLSLRDARCWFPQNRWASLALFAMLGLGVLAKGPVGFLLPMAMLGLFLLIQTSERVEGTDGPAWKRFVIQTARVCHPGHFLKTLWSMRPLTAAVVVLLIAAPWFVWVDARTNGDFTRMFFVGEHFGRATTAMENHSGGFWFYPVAILVGFFPWSVFWGPVVVGLFKNRAAIQPASINSIDDADDKQTHQLTNAATVLMLCWIGVQVVAFSMAQTKLPSYVTPCYPALAILTASCLVRFATDKSAVGRSWFVLALAAFSVTGLAITVGVGIATSKLLPSQTWLAGLGVVPCVAGALLAWWVPTQRRRLIPAAFSIAAVLFSVGLFGFGTVSLDREQQSNLIFDRLEPGDCVATYGCLESSWVFYAERPIYELTPVGETSPSIASSSIPLEQRFERMFWQPKPRVSVGEFFSLQQESVLLTTREHFEELENRLPEGFEILETASYFLKNKELLLIGLASENRKPATSKIAQSLNKRLR